MFPWLLWVPSLLSDLHYYHHISLAVFDSVELIGSLLLIGIVIIHGYQ
jgi:hypothetical protein